MRANGNLQSVTAKQGGAGGMLAPGGYACLIHAVIDGTEEDNPYIGLVLNVLDPGTKRLMYTQDLADPEQHWKHTYRYFVSAYDTPGIDWARYKALVEAVEQTVQNKGFVYQDVDGGEQQLAGKWVGCVFRHYLKVPKRGKYAGQQREGVELSYVLPAADAISGNFDPKLTERRDARPKELQGTPYPPEQQVVHAPAPVAQPSQDMGVAATAPMPMSATVAPVAPGPVAASPAPQPPQPDLYDEDLPF